MENLQTLLVNNEPDQIVLRRSRNTLRIVGSGIIIFGAWTSIKMMVLLFLLRQETVDAMRNDFGLDADVSDGFAFWAITIMVFLILAVVLSIRAYIGLSAMAEGRGKRKGILYLLLATIMIVLNAMSFFTGFTRLGETQQQMGAFTNNQTISALIIDATSTIMLIEMVVSSIRVKILTRKKRREGK